MSKYIEISKPKAVIIDLDWTTCFEPVIGDMPQNSNREVWDKYHIDRFYYNKQYFTPIKEVIRVINSYLHHEERAGYFTKPIFLTAREDTHNGLIRKNTMDFITTYFYDCFDDNTELLMREENDYRKSSVVKQEYLKEILKLYDVEIAFDDDESNRDMFLENGITVLQVYSKDVYNLIRGK